jgi:hypothetical protein
MKITLNKKLSLFFISLIFFFSFSSCLQSQPKNLTTSPVSTASEMGIPSVHTSTPIQFTPTSTATPALQPEVRCPLPNANVSIPESMSGHDAEQEILDYLSQGGSPDLLQEGINKLGSIVDSFQVSIIDINNDAVYEIALAINFNPPKDGSWEDTYGIVAIYSCIDGSYTITSVTREKQGRITIVTVENLRGSTMPEILVAKQILFRSCDEFVEMYSLEETNWLSSFKSDESPCSIQLGLENIENGYKKLIIEGKRGCSYLACGPARGRKWIYEFRDDETRLIHEELLPSLYRIHILEDGDLAIEKGDLEAAIRIYDKAARDDSLVDVVTLSERERQFTENIPLEELQKTAHKYQTSFAFFREFILLKYLNRDNEAAGVLKHMKDVYPEGKYGSELIDIASYFQDQIRSGLNAREACVATNEYLAYKYILGENNFVHPYLNGWGDLSPQIGELLCPEIE